MSDKIIYALEWTEYEQGWGNRPDGIQLFISYDKLLDVVKINHKSREHDTETPSEYTIPVVKYVFKVSDSEYETIEKLISNGNNSFTWANGKSVASLLKQFPNFIKISGDHV